MVRLRNKVHRCGKRAFTLVELIVVLVILAVIAAMLIPALTGYIKTARRAKYVRAADEARIASQAIMTELYAMGSESALSKTTGSGTNVSWNTGDNAYWGDRVLELMGRGRGEAANEPYILVFGVGTHRPEGGMDLGQQYTVYYVAYVEDEDAPALFYINGEWMYQYPRFDKSPVINTRNIGGFSFRNTIIYNGAKIPLQFFVVSNRSGISDDSAAFWTGSDSRSLLSHSDGYYGS
ncbi:MAG: type II secretion system protein [Clostridiales bacterium]|nr:type II secretion system protein [Clostridiales bacterium]